MKKTQGVKIKAKLTIDKHGCKALKVGRKTISIYFDFYNFLDSRFRQKAFIITSSQKHLRQNDCYFELNKLNEVNTPFDLAIKYSFIECLNCNDTCLICKKALIDFFNGRVPKKIYIQQEK